MTKAEIVQAIYNRLGGFSKKEAADLVDLVFDTMKETLGRGEKIKVSGFGNFVLRDKRKRQGRNPQTGEPMMITERRVLNFKASNVLKQGLNPRRTNSTPLRDTAPREAPRPAVSGASLTEFRDVEHDGGGINEGGRSDGPGGARRAVSASIEAKAVVAG